MTEQPGLTRMGKIQDWIAARATTHALAIAVGLYFASVVALPLSDAYVAAQAPQFTKRDLRFAYDHAAILATLSALGESGRRAYGAHLAIDTVMPVLFAAATILVVARAVPRWLRVLAVPPAAFLALDLVENTAFGVMIVRYPEIPLRYTLTCFTVLARVWLEYLMRSYWHRKPFKTSGGLTPTFGLRSVMLSRNTYGTSQRRRQGAGSAA